ncbi:MAG: hypothetical protein H3C63_16005, partial [Candidatus Omnitrophica bacterium]|nr:hypothetical protein [Candidatus Omnitrophota bacterium]
MGAYLLSFIHINRLRSTWMLCLCLFCAGFPVWSDSETESSPSLQSGRLTLRIEPMEDQTITMAWEDTLSGRVLNKKDHPLWQMDLRRPNGESFSIDSRQGEPTIADGTEALELKWDIGAFLPQDGSGQAETEADAIELICQIHRAPSDRLEMTLRVRNQSTGYSIQQVIFPMIALKALGESSADDVLAIPRVSGELVHDPLKKGVSFSGLYPGGWSPMSFCAEWDPQGGLYFAVEDPLGSSRDLQIKRSGDQNT